MKRISIGILFALLLLVLSSCTSMQKRPTPVAVQVTGQTSSHLFSVNVTSTMLAQAGYRHGDYVMIESEGITLRAMYNDVLLNTHITLIADEKQGTLYMPKAIKEGGKGILFFSRPPERESSSSVSFTGNFVFTF